MTTTKATTLTATYRIVTPMFCAGADQDSAELRLPSFKGALRFWWRSLTWDNVKGPGELRKKEANLFGASDSQTGQSKMRLRIVGRWPEDRIDKHTPIRGGNCSGLAYLGYGVMNFRGQLGRPALSVGKFTVECRFSPFSNRQQHDEVRNALILLGTVGGLGSKSRKGFGSLTLVQLEENGAEQDVPELPAERLTATVGQVAADLPAWTAWSRDSRVVVVQQSDSKRAIDLLDDIGREQVHYRSWGRKGLVLGKSSEENFPLDHHLSKGQSVSIDYPLRVAFGLPHNYQSGGVKPTKHDRRASPLFIHIHQVRDDDSPVGVLAFLPARFLPEGAQLSAFGNQVQPRNTEDFWFPLHGYLDRLTANGQKPPSRPGYEMFPADSHWWKKQTSITAQEIDLG